MHGGSDDRNNGAFQGTFRFPNLALTASSESLITAHFRIR